jgi:hypothetical protein
MARRQRPPLNRGASERPLRGGGAMLEGISDRGHLLDVSERPLRGGGAMLEGKSDRGHLFTGCIREAAQGFGERLEGKSARDCFTSWIIR